MRRDTCVVREALRKWQVKTKMRRSDGDGQITAPPYHFPLQPKMSLLFFFRTDTGRFSRSRPFLVAMNYHSTGRIRDEMLVPKRLGG